MSSTLRSRRLHLRTHSRSRCCNREPSCRRGLAKRCPRAFQFREGYATEDHSLNPPEAIVAALTATTSAPILFHPDGRTSTGYVTLGNDRGALITVSLTGLTGSIRVGAVRSEEE